METAISCQRSLIPAHVRTLDERLEAGLARRFKFSSTAGNARL
jgi:hypothetical protein